MPLREGYILDYISGEEIKATPEEIEAVQIFSKQLVEDYGYNRHQIQTRPQFRVKARPSDNLKTYPVDIAVFMNDKKNEDDIYIIVECKKKNRKDGKTQLEDYLRLSKAELGVWFNGEERLFIKKIEQKGKVLFEEIPNIPNKGQRIEDIGQFKKCNLKPTHNLKAVFKSIRNFLIGNATGTTRDEVIAQQLINMIFCKIYDEKFTKVDDIVRFRIGLNEPKIKVKERILGIFKDVKDSYVEVIDSNDNIDLDENSIAFVVGELQKYSLMETERDVIADAFETFIGHALKGAQGQFFTPRNVVKMMVEILDPSESDNIIDPACGSGGFLIESLKYVWRKVELKGKKYGWSDTEIDREKQKVAINNFRGIDKDYFLSKVTKAYMAIIGDGKGGIFCEDSLEIITNWQSKTQDKIELGSFNLILTNPPFGNKIKVKGDEKLKQYDLGHKWNIDKKTNLWTKGKLKKEEEPQILFIERCLELLKDGGKMAIVLPEGIFGNPSDRYIWDYITSKAVVLGVISTPAETFQPHTHFKTSILILQKGYKNEKNEIFMANALNIGHNKNGKEMFKMDNNGRYTLDKDHQKIIDDDLPEIESNFYSFIQGNLYNTSHLGFVLKQDEIKTNIYIPSYYDPELKRELEDLRKNKKIELISIGELVDNGLLQIKRGNEIGSEYYGKGDIPFVRTSDIVNWEIKFDPIKSIPEDIFNKYKNSQDIQEKDILFVKDGTFLIGRTGFITKSDIKIVIQSHLLKIRTLDDIKLSPYYLLYLLNIPTTKKQIKNFTFIQGTISTVGDRFNEILLPIDKDIQNIEKISEEVRIIINNKNELKLRTQNLISSIDF